jgi:hypothetical protein
MRGDCCSVRFTCPCSSCPCMQTAPRIQTPVGDNDRASTSSQQSEGVGICSSISLGGLPRSMHHPSTPVSLPAPPSSSCTLSSSQVNPGVNNPSLGDVKQQNIEDLMYTKALSLTEARRQLIEQKNTDNPAPRRSLSLGLLNSGSSGGKVDAHNSNQVRYI